MEFIEKILSSDKSLIVFGALGRNPSLIHFYLDSIPELQPIDELIFFHSPSSRFLYVLIEPPFNTFLSSDRWTLVFSSHKLLQWHPQQTQIIDLKDSVKKLPNVSQIFHNNILTYSEKVLPWQWKPVTLDLSSCPDLHTAYLFLLRFRDVLRDHVEWSVIASESTLSNLEKLKVL